MQSFWVPREYTDQPNATDRNIGIQIPDICPKCGDPITISGQGSVHSPTTLQNACDHTHTYPKIWEIRIIDMGGVKVKMGLSRKYVDVCPCGIHPSWCDYHQ